MTTILKTICAAALALGLASCTTTKKIATDFDTDLECKGVCDRYATCYDPQFTVSACRENCNAKAKNDGAFRRSTDACNECMTGLACVEVTAACGNDCRGVVPITPATSAR
ncbi:MAG: hypothetical protein H6Q89_4929 [Myxococcaceae bacterium]|nr:hypothetical protein [Myxococcaceae bacterium]